MRKTLSLVLTVVMAAFPIFANAQNPPTPPTVKFLPGFEKKITALANAANAGTLTPAEGKQLGTLIRAQADAWDQDGTSAAVNDYVAANQTAYVNAVTTATIDANYKIMQKKGYKGTLADFTAEETNAAKDASDSYTYFTQQGTHGVMYAAADFAENLSHKKGSGPSPDSPKDNPDGVTTSNKDACLAVANATLIVGGLWGLGAFVGCVPCGVGGAILSIAGTCFMALC